MGIPGLSELECVERGVYCGLSHVPIFLPASLIVRLVPWLVALIAPV